MMPPTTGSGRRDDLDALRGFAMLLGIVLHASLAYFPFPWSVQDPQQSKAFGLVYAVIHGFRMPLFFLLSGFFTMLVLERRGLWTLLAQRTLRIFVPLVVAAVTILPLTHATITLAVRRTAAATAAGSPLVGRILAGDRDGVHRLLATSTITFVPDVNSWATPLSLAAMGGDTEIVTALIDAGAPIGGPNRDGSTPLHVAAFMGQADVVRLLLERGANPAAANAAGDLPRDSAAAPPAIAAYVAEFLGLPARSAVDVQRGRDAIAGVLAPEATAAESPGLGVTLVARYSAALASPSMQFGMLDHLWFLWYLCLMVAGLAVAETAGFGPSGRHRWWLVPGSCLPFALMWSPFGPDTSLALIPPPHLILFYACFFWFGAGTFRCEGLETPLGRRWMLVLPLSLGVIFPAAIATIGRQPWVATLQPLFAWGMSLGLIGLFHDRMARPSAAVRWLADASYWMYLAHLPLVIILQSYACDLPWPAVAKFTAVNVVTVAVLLATYRWCVRFTPIGWLLNGLRTRPGDPGRTDAVRTLRDLPGPRGWPLVGNLLQIRPALVHHDVERWAAEFGSLYRLRFGRKDLLVIADHDVATVVLRDRPDGFRRSPLNARIGREMGLIQGMVNAEGEQWRKQRRMVMASFAPGHVRSYFPSLAKVTLRLRDRWQTAARERRPIPLQADLMRFTVDVIAGLAFGSDINTLASGDDVIQQHLEKVLPVIYRRMLSIVPYWRWLKLPADRAVDRSVAVINAAIRDYVAQARQRLSENPGRAAAPQNLLEAMIVAADEPGSGLDDTHVIGNVLTMLLAGEDTTANTMAWMIDLLVRHPAARRRAEEEVRSIAPDPAAFSFDQIEQLTYLEACVHETLRLKPAIPLLTLQAIDDTVVGDVAIPRDTPIWVLLRHDAISGEFFDRPEAFEPERWLADAKQPLTTAARHASMPFGSGPRVCPGRYLAILEMKMAVAMLLASFDIEAVDTPDGGPAQEQMAFTLQPVGQRLRLRDRG